jgi:hypothetical protein
LKFGIFELQVVWRHCEVHGRAVSQLGQPFPLQVSVVVVFINGEMTTTTTTWNGEIIFWGAAGFAGENLR